MPIPKSILRAWLIVCAVLLLLLALVALSGCATPTPAPVDVGRVVVAPQRQLPPPPLIVQQTQPKLPGYFLQSLLNYFEARPERPTPSTSPTPPAAPTAKP